MQRMKVLVKKAGFGLIGLMVFLIVASMAIAEERTLDGPIREVVNSAKARTLDAAGGGAIVQSAVVDRLNRGEETVDVIVLLKGYKEYVGKIKADKPAEMKKFQAEIRPRQDAVLKRLSRSQFTPKHRFDNILGFAGTVSRDGLEALAAMQEVESIEEDQKVEAHLAQGIPLMNGSHVRSSYDGAGVSIAITDTGIDYTHPMLGGAAFPNAKVIGGYDFGDSDADPMDCQGHGTSVAGIAAGTAAAGPGDYIGGVAPNARLYALKIVAGCSGSSAFSTIAAAWDWAVSHKNDDPANPILAINTSFGGGYYTAACDASIPTIAAAANNAAANGITLFSSSGNDGFSDGMGAPACVSNSLSVGAVYDANIGSRYWSPCTDLMTAPDQVTCYSNSANFLNILAPSNDAYTTAVGGGYRTNFGGTSAASPYSAGAGAVLQSYAKKTAGHYYSAAELRARLISTGDPVIDPKNGITKPRVNIGVAAVQLEQTPWKTNENGTVATDVAWNYTMGYHFTPVKDGHIRWLGGYFNGTKTVSLWNKATGALLASAVVTSSNGWGYTAIKAVPVTAGTTYTVAVYLGGSGGSYRYNIAPLPDTYGDVTINGSTYIAGNARPTNTYTTYMFGQADFGYVPASVQTPWLTNENGTLVTDIAWDYTMGYNFTPRKDGQITRLSGYFNGAKTVSLWNKATGELLAQQNVTSSNNWSSVDIDPVLLNAGVTYTVAVYLGGSGGSYRSGIAAFPQTYGDITIEGSAWLFGNGRPTNNYASIMYGQVDVGFSAFSGQTPWKRNENGTLVTDIAWDYTMGYHFTPKRSGTITWLGGYFNGTKTVYLWNKSTGALLAQATVSSANGWGYANIDPVRVTAGTTYTVAVYLAGSGGSYRYSITALPQTYGDITIEGTTWLVGNGRPTIDYAYNMYGQMDIGFVPDSSQTPWMNNENGTLVTDIAWDYTMGYHFIPARNGTISRLGGYFNGAKTVSLWDTATGTLLAQAPVTSSNAWSYVGISPVSVTAGTTYTVAVYLGGGGGSYRYGISTFPQTYEDVTITGSTWLSGNGRPTNTITTYMYGQVDVEFEP